MPSLSLLSIKLKSFDQVAKFSMRLSNCVVICIYAIVLGAILWLLISIFALGTTFKTKLLLALVEVQTIVSFDCAPNAN
jgi:hypothetical protein